MHVFENLEWLLFICLNIIYCLRSIIGAYVISGAGRNVHGRPARPHCSVHLHVYRTPGDFTDAHTAACV